MNAPVPNGTVLMILCVGIAAAAISDLRYRKIPNTLVSSIAAAGIVHAAAALGPRGAAASLLGAGAGVALLAWPFVRGVLGGGDVKLLGAVGAWIGAAETVRVLLLGAVLGGVLALGFLLSLTRSQRAGVRRNVASFTVPSVEHLDRARAVPYGLALAGAAAWVLLSGAR
ncbi:A24 family peptidase [Pendulispora brunnea]|uniref:A24 family peptidase n=1 Tax=Pendulispora brunnea TaxID=2905690 RepID=A0ABZ2JY41_9BACT